jgi:hypothetical protein
MVDYSDDTFSTVEMIANGKGLGLVCNYVYELTDGDKVVYWSYYLHDVLNFLRNYKNA